MADLKKSAIGLLATKTGVNLNAVASTTLFTVPALEEAVITHVVIRDLTADAVACVITLGQSGAATDWLGSTNIGTNLTAAAKTMLLLPKVNDGSFTGSVAWDPGSIADGDEEAKDITVTGAALGDFTLVSFSLDVADLVLNGQVTAANTVTAILANNTGGAIDLGAGTVYAKVIPATPQPPSIVEYQAGTAFVVDVTTAVGGACTATFDVYGRLKTA